ncbi:MAG TPA: cytochrome c oxidase subunit 3 [Beijerinckiaceae bacterium]|jgi:cytochrome c oxidase subunit 3
MGVAILFFSGLSLVAVWWLSKHRLFAKPWLEPGAAGEFPGGGVSDVPVAKVGLGVFLAVVGALFALFVSAYVMRMGLADWRPVPKPTVLWINTGVLMLASGALQWARAAAERDDLDGARTGLLAAGAATLAFMAGQAWAWRELTGSGWFLASNPASTFFYLITALHALHLVGGLAALARSAVRAWRPDPDPARLRLGLELCSLYWDFLLLIWLVLFGLLWLT